MSPVLLLAGFLILIAGSPDCLECPAAQARPNSASAEPSGISGTIQDPSGRPLPGAEIIVRTPAGIEARTASGPDGRFSLSGSGAGERLLVVRALGFAEWRQKFGSEASGRHIEIVLTPATVSETVTVTAARVEQRTASVAASVSVLGRDAVQRSPALVADDVLRQVPTFSLFRRTSSLASHPTAQGVSLRGVGPSGVSRTLVLFDGVPLNDPFGGWVYWTRIPLGSVDRIEVVDGATSSVYGNYAMGGVVNIVPAQPARSMLDIRSQYGNRDTPKVDLSGTHVRGRLRGSIDGTVFDTSGYPIVAASERGIIDRNASVSFANVTAKVQYDFSDRVQAFARGWRFREDRSNGKVSTIDGTEEANDTTWTSLSTGVRIRLQDGSDLQASVFGDRTRFASNFLAVPAATPPRSIGRMTLDQTVPSRGLGGMAQWSRALGTRQFITAGADWRWVDGESREEALDALTGTRVTLERVSGGRQQSAGLFVQDMITPVPRLILTAAARVDRWRNYDGHNRETTVPGREPTANHNASLPERRDTVASPRISALYHVTDWLTLWGAAGTGFRAPTLNELYRQFRVGAVTTLANSQLGPERLISTDGGIRITPASNLVWRTTVFDNRVKDPVSNVTLTSTGVAVVQQRQNLGRTRIRGVQTDVELRIGPFARVTGAYVYDDAKVTEFAGNPELAGKFLPQVPRHRATFQASYSNPAVVNVSVGVQAIGRQFDDDQNTRAVPGRTEPGLPGLAVVDVSVSRRIGRRVEVFGGIQNLLNQEYFVGTLPTTVGTPRLAHGGLRLRFESRQD